MASRFGWQLLFIGCLIRSANEIKNSAGDIRKAVEKLEAIFDRMYTDTFGIMKDTVTDMRQHVWKEPVVSKQESEEYERRFDELRSKLSKEVDDALLKQEGTDRKIDDLRQDIRRIVEETINKTRKVDGEIKEKKIRAEIIEAIKELTLNDKIPTATSISSKINIDIKELVLELFKLAREKKIIWKTLKTKSALRFDEPIEILNSKDIPEDN